MLCLVCNHGFSWRIAPLERVCSSCGTLHVLKSGLWRLGSQAKAAEGYVPATRTAVRATATRVPSMKIVPSLGMTNERRS
jgi:hypothetical protein